MELPKAPNFQTLADRLRWAIEQEAAQGRQRGLRLFQRRMAEAGAGGTALSSIQSYLSGASQPSLAFVERAAEVLSVRPAWLGFGAGFPTDKEQSEVEAIAKRVHARMAGTETAFASAESLVASASGAIQDAISTRLPSYWRLPGSARHAVFLALMQYVGRWKEEDEPFAAIADRFARYLASPFEIARIEADRLDPASLAIILEGLLRAFDVANYSGPDADSNRVEHQRQGG